MVVVGLLENIMSAKTPGGRLLMKIHVKKHNIRQMAAHILAAK